MRFFLFLFVVLKAGFEILNVIILGEERIEKVFHKSIPEKLHLGFFNFRVEFRPNFDSIVELEGSIGLMGDEPDAIYVLGAALGFTKEIEKEPFINFLILFNVLVNLENESASKFVILILPSWIDSFSEIIDSTNILGVILNFKPKLVVFYID